MAIQKCYLMENIGSSDLGAENNNMRFVINKNNLIVQNYAIFIPVTQP
jgi:hypothetical protein